MGFLNALGILRASLTIHITRARTINNVIYFVKTSILSAQFVYLRMPQWHGALVGFYCCDTHRYINDFLAIIIKISQQEMSFLHYWHFVSVSRNMR